MRIGVLGTGAVGQALATRLVSLGHDVMMGSRDAANPKAMAWARGTTGPGPAWAGSFADAVRHGEVVINATAGTASLAALNAAGGGEALSGKVLVDVANPVDYSVGAPPTLAVANDDSLGEQIQRAFPQARVVKTLNTVNANVMVQPAAVPGGHTVFLAGDDPAARQTVIELLRELGWLNGDILDLGGIQAARGMEMYVPLWLSMMAAQQTPMLNIRVARA
jgi:8-hydroxy-5-deazaflavin:NADPH oxidoreductase